MPLTLRYKWHSPFNNLITLNNLPLHFVSLYVDLLTSSSVIVIGSSILSGCMETISCDIGVFAIRLPLFSCNCDLFWAAIKQFHGMDKFVANKRTGCLSHNLYWPQFVWCSWRKIRSICYDSCNITITVRSEWRLLVAWCLLGMFPRKFNKSGSKYEHVFSPKGRASMWTIEDGFVYLGYNV